MAATAGHGLSPILRAPAADTPRPHVRKRRPCDALSAHASHTAPRSTQTRQFICRLCQLPGVTVSQAIQSAGSQFFFTTGKEAKAERGATRGLRSIPVTAPAQAPATLLLDNVDKGHTYACVAGLSEEGGGSAVQIGDPRSAPRPLAAIGGHAEPIWQHDCSPTG